MGFQPYIEKQKSGRSRIHSFKKLATPQRRDRGPCKALSTPFLWSCPKKWGGAPKERRFYGCCSKPAQILQRPIISPVTGVIHTQPRLFPRGGLAAGRCPGRISGQRAPRGAQCASLRRIRMDKQAVEAKIITGLRRDGTMSYTFAPQAFSFGAVPRFFSEKKWGSSLPAS